MIARELDDTDATTAIERIGDTPYHGVFDDDGRMIAVAFGNADDLFGREAAQRIAEALGGP